MNGKDFHSYYEKLTDDQLLQVLADKQELVPEAAVALDQEVQKRQVKLPEPPH